MQINVKLFAAARELAGHQSIELELPTEATVAHLRHALIERLPQARQLLAKSTFAVDCDYATDQTPLSPRCDVAWIPPVSGG
jgi:molybdopterin converting factor subunit 1